MAAEPRDAAWGGSRLRGFRAYRPLARVAFASTMNAKGSFLLGVLISGLTMLAVLFLWRAVYEQRSSVGGVTWDEMKTYLVITFATSRLVSYSIGRIGRRVLDGSIAVDLTRPLDFQLAQLNDAFGVALVEAGAALAVAGAAALALGGIVVPDDPLLLLLFAVSLVLVVPLKFSLVYLFNLAVFWTSNSMGVMTTFTTINLALSGTYVPITLFPGWLEAVARALPFQALAFAPAWIFVGQVDASGALILIGVQAAWILVLGVAGRLLWHRAARAVTIHGG